MNIKSIEDHPKYEPMENKMNYKESKAPKSLKLFKRKHLNYKERKELINHYFSDLEKEYYEANNATNIYNMFCEFLEVIPKNILIDNESLLLFKSALEDTTNIKAEDKQKIKKYI